MGDFGGHLRDRPRVRATAQRPACAAARAGRAALDRVRRDHVRRAGRGGRGAAGAHRGVRARDRRYADRIRVRAAACRRRAGASRPAARDGEARDARLGGGKRDANDRPRSGDRTRCDVRWRADDPRGHGEKTTRVAPPAEDEPREKAAAVIQRHTEAGAARERRASLDRRGLPKLEPNPALVRHAQERAQSIENRLADRITLFAGSMRFVYIHMLWFGCWIGFGVERYPYGLLTMIVSLEAIFLSTFVMISQNRADAKRQAIANQQWQTVKEEDTQNEEMLDRTHQILELTHAIRVAQGGEPLVDRDLEPDDREAEGAVDGAGDDRGREGVLRT